MLKYLRMKTDAQSARMRVQSHATLENAARRWRAFARWQRWAGPGRVLTHHEHELRRSGGMMRILIGHVLRSCASFCSQSIIHT